MRRVGLALFAALAVASAAKGDDRVADTRRLLDLLTGVRVAYTEAFEGGEEELFAAVDLEEARLLLADARSLNERLRLLPGDGLAAVARQLESHVGGFEVPARLDALAADVTKRTGVERDTRPSAPPSAAHGRDLFGPNCAGCHGERGAGDGPDAARAGITPADFTNVLFMRRETPADFFDRITLGHRRRGMPEWSALTTQQRWDLVAYVWTLGRSDDDRREGRALWANRCTSCHGAAGAGVPGKATDLTRPGSLMHRTDRAIFVVLSRGPHAAAGKGLSDAERWRLVGQARDLALGGSPPPRSHGAR